MKRNSFVQTILGLSIALMLAGLSGCAGGKVLQRTEAGYMPTHFAAGEIIPYTAGVSTVNYTDLVRLTEQSLRKIMYEHNLNYIREKALATTAVPAEKIAVIDMELTFLAGTRGITTNFNVQIVYTIRRKSDGFVWRKGSVQTTDEAVSQAATMDLQSAIQYAITAMVKEIRAAESQGGA